MIAGTTVGALRCEHQIDPLGIDTQRPRFGWQLSSDRRNVVQTRYQIVVGTSAAGLLDGRELVWDSAAVESDRSVDIEYAGPALRSRTCYYWTVRSWIGDEVTAWAEPAWWEMGLLSESDWSAHWIEAEQRPAQPEPPIENFTPGDLSVLLDIPVHHELLNPAQLIRKTFTVGAGVERARVYATAHGVYTLELNGSRVGDRVLAPEATAYDSYLMYQTYDVTDALRSGENAIGATIADGWYAGRLGLNGAAVNYGDKLGLLLQLEITYADGTVETIATDESFRSSTGPIRYADLLIGEKRDARLDQPGWSTAQFDDADWRPVTVAGHGYGNVVAQYGEPVRVVAELPCVGAFVSPAGEQILDFGQNVAGRIRMRVSGSRGTEVTLAHSQTLDEDGNFFSNILGANNENTDVYVLAGEGTETFEPQFTYHGFRYVKVSGYPGELDPANFTSVALSSDSPAAIEFETSDPMVNRMQDNIAWTLRSNCLSIPTDNPDRERAGWSGDLQAITPTATFNLGLQAFLTRWLRNMVREQRQDGQIPWIVPYFKCYRDTIEIALGSHSAAAWGDVSVITPWTLYNVYGDRRILEETYEAGRRWLDYVATSAKDSLSEDDAADPELAHLRRAVTFGFGDWLTPSQTTVADSGFYDLGSTVDAGELVPTLYYAHCAELLGKIAAVLGEERESARFAELAENVKRSFRKAFVRDDGTLTQDLQGMYVLALQLDMAPDLRDRFLQRLVELIHKNGGKLDSGFLSTPYLLPLLSENGHNELAYAILFGEESPSWMYQVKNGATTVWEMWDSIQTSGRVTRTSQNQPGLTTVGAWLYRTVGGIGAAAPGYKRIDISPRPSERLTFARVRYESVHGPISSSWEHTDDRMRLAVSIPPNTSAAVRLDGAALADVTENGTSVADCDDVLAASQAQDAVIVEIGSGDYAFEYVPRTEPASIGA
ncbi:family 78 glycoside hydrolase catalytic domain [Streptomyces albicerus]|uniref:family 78 glycoside hydrolase catalytic domain n=1 Tax=Streptomyces albicerus TaxID=2569859 RepID=UPI00124AEFA9|nr:family 78 glycoside hydrolase catalytic domain [Streptomyces albicerus]